MKKFRLRFILLLAALVLALVPAVFAQDTLNASQEVYDLFTTANETTAALKTVTYAFTAHVDVTGLGESNITLDLTGGGVVDNSNAASPAAAICPAWRRTRCHSTSSPALACRTPRIS